MNTDKVDAIGAIVLGIFFFLIIFIVIGEGLAGMESCSQRHAIVREK